MQLVLVPSKKEDIDKYKTINNYIIGVKDFSVNYNFVMDINEIINLSSEYSNKNIFVVINKNIMNDDLQKLEQMMIDINNSNIKGILFYDMAVLSIKKRLNLKIDLVWNQGHMVTNYNTCNYYYDKGVNFAYISNEITLEEMIEIKKNSKIKLFTLLFGYPIMAHSKRKLLTNYSISSNKNILKDSHKIVDKISNKEFIIKEDNIGTSILFGDISNHVLAIDEMLKNDFDYGVIDSNYINSDTILEMINIIDRILLGEDLSSYKERIINLIGDNSSFLYKKTIYKVKRK
ncbi:MAG: U32 family peptidase [Bacilli bacterium]|nr:U32 family peptidase [Bacilli bacterium]